MTEQVMVVGGTSGQNILAQNQDVTASGFVQLVEENGKDKKPVMFSTEEKPSMREAKPSMKTWGLGEKPKMFTGESNTGNPSANFSIATSATDNLQWYHWLGIAIILAAIVYGIYYWYKKRNNG